MYFTINRLKHTSKYHLYHKFSGFTRKTFNFSKYFLNDFFN
jgi:hypothetical protein